MYHSFLIHSSADEHLGCFHVLAIMQDSKRDTDVWNSLLDSVGEGEGGPIIWENGIETYNIIYETNHQSRFDAGYWMLGAGALG